MYRGAKISFTMLVVAAVALCLAAPAQAKGAARAEKKAPSAAYTVGGVTFEPVEGWYFENYKGVDAGCGVTFPFGLAPTGGSRNARPLPPSAAVTAEVDTGCAEGYYYWEKHTVRFLVGGELLAVFTGSISGNRLERGTMRFTCGEEWECTSGRGWDHTKQSAAAKAAYAPELARKERAYRAAEEKSKKEYGARLAKWQKSVKRGSEVYADPYGFGTVTGCGGSSCRVWVDRRMSHSQIVRVADPREMTVPRSALHPTNSSKANGW